MSMNIDILKKSHVGKHFLIFIEAGIQQPSIDTFLEYRTHCMGKKEEVSPFADEWYDLEIAATDEILKILTDSHED
jgi:hypothetical protein